MVHSNRAAVVLVTEDPMVEVAIRHLFGVEHLTFELRRVLSFSALTEGSPITGIAIVLADVLSSKDLDRLALARTQMPGSSLICWSSSALLATPHIRQKCEGMVSRLASSADLMAVLRQVVSGKKAPQRYDLSREVNIHLTFREGQLLALLAQGYSNKKIAACLGISAGTVKVYLSTLFKKTGAKDRFELTLFGMKNFLFGVAELSGPVPIPLAERRAIARPLLKSMRLVQPVLTPPAQAERSYSS